ncbi:D-alanyl-D-alanine carboxypeptidase family protein [Bacillus sp. CGMCC 1.16607]|uniref:M15 family metallopeptidase n=1 Tax=Bacillus sp. CGMCC 1.16607 TaxID=3351842 RepID=UPI0036382B57
MKKLMLFSTTTILLLSSGCTRLDSYIDKIPFFSAEKEGKYVKEDEHHSAELKEEDSNSKQASDPTETNSNKEPVTSVEEEMENEITLEGIFFNQIKEVNGLNIIQNPENTMALVNKQFGLPNTFLPNDLMRPAVTFSFGDQKLEKSMLRKKAAVALEAMFADAKNNGIELFAVSGYRSYAYQDMLFKAEVKKVGKEKAMEAVAYPGQSEHQTGLSMDISSKREEMLLTENFGNTPEGKWLAENAHRFGFILRYPKGKESITGYQYEPWHFRYVGTEASEDIYENQWTLEEYFNNVKKI